MTKHRVSGVPYEVDLETYTRFNATDYASTDDMIAELERENFMLRARIERLEREIERYQDDGK